MNLMRDFGMKQMANLSREFKLIKLTLKYYMSKSSAHN